MMGKMNSKIKCLESKELGDESLCPIENITS